MTRQELLTSTRLRLNPRVRTSTAHKLRVLLKAPAGRRWVVVTPAQARLLTDYFAQPSTVPAALVALLGKGQCPPLREYYELILQCGDAGVLIAEGVEANAEAAPSWPVPFSPKWAGRIGLVGLVLGMAAMPFGRWQLPAGPLEWIGSLLAACGLLSLGQLFAACTLAGAKCEIRSRRMQWKSLLPHFQVATDDAAMGGPAIEMAVAVLRVTPVALGAAAAAWWQPGLLFVIHLAVLLLLAPWGGSAALQWLRARFGSPRLSIETGRLLEIVEENSRTSSAAHEVELSRRGGVYWGLGALLWCAWIIAATGRIFPGIVDQLGPWADRWLRQGPWGRIVFSLAAAAVLLGSAWLATTAFRRWRARRGWRARLGEKRSLLMRDQPLAGATLTEVLKQFVVLQTLADDDLAALAEAVQPMQVSGGSIVFEEDSPGDAFYFVAEGTLEITKQLPGRLRRTKVIGELGAGDSFGEIALLENAPRTATVRAVHPTRLLRLSREDFDRLLARRVGAKKLREVLQNTAFLGRLVHFAGWTIEDLTGFARHCASVRFDRETTVLRRGQPNELFYLVYDGVFEVRDGKKVLQRLAPGDYFGENSLLGISPAAGQTLTVEYFDASNPPETAAAADIVAVEEGRCLTMHRSQFLSFFARDFRVSIRMASRASR